ncbi:MAG: hypothetical protein ABI619_10275 [Betaproteobacteria bacterium]
MLQTRAAAGLHYAGAENLNALLDECQGHVLGIVAFGKPGPCFPDVPFSAVDMPVLGNDTCYEVWTGTAPVQIARHGGIHSAHDPHLLFGCMAIPDDAHADYAALIYQNYCRIFDHLDAEGFPKLLRIWHYLPDIHRNAQQFERYQQFSLGRHQAFVAKGRTIRTDAPAASAVGKHSGNTIISFLAAPHAGTPVENPRQVSAYAYPAQYGPRGPTFSRALFTAPHGKAQLYISGTAAILGHASQHEGNVEAQTDETIANLRAVLNEARTLGLIDGPACDMALTFKVYVRQPEYRSIVLRRLREAFGEESSILFLHADICRRELLLEIEAVCSSRTRMS